MIKKTKKGIMFAADVKNKKELFGILDKIAPHIKAVKFNYPLILKEGIKIISQTKQKYKKIILADFKIADVPVTNNRIVKIVKDAGADAVMAHGFIGVDALISLKEAAGNVKIILMTQLTNPGGLDFYADFSYEFARLARTLELDGVQAPGNRPAVIRKVRKITGEDLMIVSCGVGAQGGKFGEAIKAGADFEIIGRSIYESKDPLLTVKYINTEIKKKNA